MPEVKERVDSMSVIGDVRSVIQDLVSPDLKATVAKLDGITSLMETRLKAQDEIAAARHSELLAKLETFNAQHTARYDTIMKSLDVDARLKALEAKDAGPQRQTA
jgi:hypothetical protein